MKGRGFIMKVKIFSNEGNAPELEKEINKWLGDNKNVEIVHVKQSYAYDNTLLFYTLMSVWYTG
jgi:hypothetical protein